MKLSIETSRSGDPTLQWERRSIHSSFDPVREADRFVQKSTIHKNPACIVLLGPGLGYLIRAVKSRFPDAHLICLFYAEEIFALCQEKDHANWYPETDIPLLQFLRNQINDTDAEGVEILEWKASTAIFFEKSNYVKTILNHFIMELRGNYTTINAVGKLWIKNSILNFLAIDSVLKGNPAAQNLPTVIAASGPSLEKVIPILGRHRELFNLWALPSAVGELSASDLLPDLIVMTDPSYYSICHLHSAAGKKIRLAMPLSAAPGAWRITNRIYLLSQPNFFEELILKMAGINTIRILPAGTVAASALEIASKTTSKEIIFCGLDLCYDDIRSHTRTNLADLLLMYDSKRTAPRYSRIFSRAAESSTLRQDRTRSSPSLTTYAGWFSSSEIRREVYRFNPAPQTINRIRGLTDIMPDKIEGILKRVAKSRTETCSEEKLGNYPSPKKRYEIINSILQEWIYLLNEAAEKFKRSRNNAIILKDPKIFALAYFIGFSDLCLLKKEERRGISEQENRGLKLIISIHDFVRQLQLKIKKPRSKLRGILC